MADTQQPAPSSSASSSQNNNNNNENTSIPPTPQNGKEKELIKFLYARYLLLLIEKKPTAVIVIGMAGSGKTTLMQVFFYITNLKTYLLLVSFRNNHSLEIKCTCPPTKNTIIHN